MLIENMKNPIKNTNSRLYYLCADDFGWSAGVNDAVLHLSEKKILDGVSVMIFGSWPKDHIQRIKESNVELGLHLDFTSCLDCEANNKLHYLLVKSHLGLINKNKVKKFISFQIAEFVRKIGRLPDFIDGHQHVHQFPVIREEMIRVLNGLELPSSFWIRNTVTNDSSNIKANLLNFLGGLYSKNLLNRANYRTNGNFLGVYSFSSSDNYRKYFKEWMSKAAASKEKSIIMCHPGLNKPSKLGDVIFNSRVSEFKYFSSDKYYNDLLNISGGCND